MTIYGQFAVAADRITPSGLIFVVFHDQHVSVRLPVQHPLGHLRRTVPRTQEQSTRPKSEHRNGGPTLSS